MNSSTIGVIGGADGPTAVFITSPGVGFWAIAALVLFAAAGLILWVCHRNKH